MRRLWLPTFLLVMATIPLLIFGLVFRILSRQRIPLLPMERFNLILYMLNGNDFALPAILLYPFKDLV